MFKLPSIRAVNYLSAIACLFLLLAAAYLQYEIHLKPCPLCVVQRIIVLVLGMLFLLAGLIHFKKTAHRWFHFLIFLVASLGAAVASRHIWLESQPIGKVDECGPSLTYILKILPLDKAFQFLFAGSGHCGKVTWQFLNFSIPHWTLLFFVFFGLIAFWQIFRKKF